MLGTAVGVHGVEAHAVLHDAPVLPNEAAAPSAIGVSVEWAGPLTFVIGVMSWMEVKVTIRAVLNDVARYRTKAVRALGGVAVNVIAFGLCGSPLFIHHRLISKRTK